MTKSELEKKTKKELIKLILELQEQINTQTITTSSKVVNVDSSPINKRGVYYEI